MNTAWALAHGHRKRLLIGAVNHVTERFHERRCSTSTLDCVCKDNYPTLVNSFALRLPTLLYQYIDISAICTVLYCTVGMCVCACVCLLNCT